ncbi:hypothetical protein ABKV19_009907 [Rosa sericea]
MSSSFPSFVAKVVTWCLLEVLMVEKKPQVPAPVANNPVATSQGNRIDLSLKDPSFVAKDNELVRSNCEARLKGGCLALSVARINKGYDKQIWQVAEHEKGDKPFITF